jgi:hypothetical protein
VRSGSTEKNGAEDNEEAKKENESGLTAERRMGADKKHPYFSDHQCPSSVSFCCPHRVLFGEVFLFEESHNLKLQ